MPSAEVQIPAGWSFGWGERYTLGALRFRSVKLVVFRFIILLAILAALASLGLFVFLSLPLIARDEWWLLITRSPGIPWVAWSVVLGGYTWYRLERERSWYPRLPQTPGAVAVDHYLSEDAWRVLTSAYHYASKLKHAEVDPLHLWVASLESRTGQHLVARLGVQVEQLVATIRGALILLPQGKSPVLSESGKVAFARAAALALQRRTHRLEVSELLVALAQGESMVKDVLEELAIPPTAITNITSWFSLRRKLMSEFSRRSRQSSYHPKRALDRTYTALATPFLNESSRDLTAMARGGYLAPCVGRDEELSNVFRLLANGRSSIVLIGETGVGRSSILHGLAQAMVADEVPVVLQDKRLILLSLPQLLGGAAGADANQRLLHALQEAAQAGNVVLAIENLHQLFTISGSGSELALADVLAHVITRYRLVLVATADRSAWRAVETSALGQACQALVIEELNDDEAIQVLESRVPAIENERRVFFSYGALEAAVKLSRRYVPDRHLPEKAIVLVEEAAGYVRDHRGRNTVVTSEDIAQVVAKKVHVPVTQVTQGEREKLLNLAELLHKRIIGQNEAVQLVAEALQRGRMNLRDQKRPVASFLFLGPTGVGKTELAKAVAAEYFGGEDKMVRLDMSEYQTADSLYRLVGTPGTSGQNASGLLTEAIRRQPYALVLLDEVEKAHLDILNVFLQVFDDGRLTDATGRTVDFSNTIIIATSNAATQFIQESLEQNTPLEFIRRSLMKGGLQQYFRPELLNRFDGIVVFRPLDSEEVVKVTELMVKKVAEQLESQGIHMRASDEAIRELAQKGFDPLFGARPLRRAVQDNIESALARFMLSGKITRRDVVVLEAGGEIRVEKAARFSG